MKIPLQEKIAELEQRIEKLEKQQARHVATEKRSAEVFSSSSWREMWRHFDEVMRRAFS